MSPVALACCLPLEAAVETPSLMHLELLTMSCITQTL
uniref:Uncharacterized protein n=1 Tax=Anguilla anguilla TaxID=7936 RepID=A0A0E9V4M4_ANGAN